MCVCSPLSAICQLNARKNSFLNAFPLRCAEREIVHKKKRDREGGRKGGSGTARIVMTNVFNYFRLVFNWPQNAARCNSKAFALGLVTHYFHYAAPSPSPTACYPLMLLIPCGPSTRARTTSGSVQKWKSLARALTQTRWDEQQHPHLPAPGNVCVCACFLN